MGTLDEIAHGLTEILRRSAMPEPLRVDLWNEGPREVTYLVRAVIDECTASGFPLAMVRTDLAAWTAGDSDTHEGVPVTTDAALKGRVEFHRRTED